LAPFYYNPILFDFKTNPMEKIIAVVVTHNSHISLKKCIESLRSQTQKPDAILVVNNGSADFTSVWLDKQIDLLHINQENSGTAGGFHTGIEDAYNKGYNWIWCMNDKGVLKEDALEKMIKEKNPQPALVNSSVINIHDRKTLVFKTNQYQQINEIKEDVIYGISHPFNGTLIHRSIVEKVGLPKKELFICGDGTEYFYRIVKQFKIPTKTATQSILYMAPVNYSQKEDWDYKTSWKMYYHLRNKLKVLQTKYQSKLLGAAAYFIFICSEMTLTMIHQKTDKFRKLNFILWPVADAIKGNYKMQPEFVMKKMNEQLFSSRIKLLLNPVKNALYNLLLPSVREETGTATA
jgi:rhamnopyranosyl-N-acetylglucosaminyl-diphospho-decaprenol beta-1,3/1,4-galactofuranosyltransferase